MEAGPSERDGFRRVGAEACYRPWLNLERFRNECSPFSTVVGRTPLDPDELLVDSFYGQAYDFSVDDEWAVYGETANLPPFPLDKHANYGYLRVPFRRVPRCRVRSREELEAVLAEARARHAGDLVVRGQTREYRLGRSPETLAALYGDPDALEPSLLPSAERGPTPFEAVMVEWVGFVRFYLLALVTALAGGGAPEAAEEFEREVSRLGVRTDLYLLALSLAQHYGLPSMGLDVTDDLDSALFFALSDFELVAENPRVLRRTDRRGADGDEPVVYVFAPFERFRLEYESYRPSRFPRGRPDHQRARFLHTGWGLNRNACARNLCIAFYLDPSGDFGPARPAAEMFPGPNADHFGSVIENIRQWDVSPQLTQYLEGFSWVAPD